MLARILLVALLLMNLGVAAWWALRTPPQERNLPRGEPGVAVIRLISESDDESGAQPLTATEGDLVAQGEAADLSCEQLGPFLSQADLRRAVRALTPQVSRLQFRETRALTNRGFWVFLPAQGTRTAALASARELSARGLRDYYVVTAGDQENTISLGLFRDRNNAEKRREEVRALGFEPELTQRTEEVPNYWIEYAAAPGFEWTSFLTGFPAIEATRIDCG